MYTVEDWIADLRSGKYKQGPSRLRTLTDEFCCLGVAAHNMSTGILNESRNTYHYDGSAHFLSPRLAELLGLVHTDGTFDWRTLPEEIIEKVLALPRNGGAADPSTAHYPRR
ncbi:MAG: hypothetical protein AB7U75_14505 [Hyphomicrobiaceae bacterium]